MGLLSGFAAGAAGGIQSGWADNRQAVADAAKKAFQLRLQDRQDARADKLYAKQREDQLIDNNIARSDAALNAEIEGIQNKKTRKQDMIDYESKALIDAKYRGNSKTSKGWDTKEILIDGIEYEVGFNKDTGQFDFDSNPQLNIPTLDLETAMKQAKKGGLLSLVGIGGNSDEEVAAEAQRLVEQSKPINRLRDSDPATTGRPKTSFDSQSDQSSEDKKTTEDKSPKKRVVDRTKLAMTGEDDPYKPKSKESELIGFINKPEESNLVKLSGDPDAPIKAKIAGIEKILNDWVSNRVELSKDQQVEFLTKAAAFAEKGNASELVEKIAYLLKNAQL